MASELRVNTLKDASGNNSVATSTVASGITKAMGFVDADGAAHKSGNLNISGVVDSGADGKVFSFTASFAAEPNCSIGQFNVGHMGNTNGAFNFSLNGSGSGITLKYYNGSAYTDTAHSLLAKGDLA